MVIVVEGKNDRNKIESIFKDAFIIITNGSEINDNVIDTIKTLANTNEVILCLDPDGPGEKIRKKIMENVPTCKNVYADKSKAISKNHKKVGIEHMTTSEIKKLFSYVYTPTYEGNITFEELYDLGLMESKVLREKLCMNLHIGYCNAKQLLKRLNMLNININVIKENLKWLSMKQEKF